MHLAVIVGCAFTAVLLGYDRQALVVLVAVEVDGHPRGLAVPAEPVAECEEPARGPVRDEQPDRENDDDAHDVAGLGCHHAVQQPAQLQQTHRLDQRKEGQVVVGEMFPRDHRNKVDDEPRGGVPVRDGLQGEHRVTALHVAAHKLKKHVEREERVEGVLEVVQNDRLVGDDHWRYDRGVQHADAHDQVEELDEPIARANDEAINPLGGAWQLDARCECVRVMARVEGISQV